MKRNLTNILKWFSSVGNTVKAVLALIAFVSAVIGGVRGYNAYIVNKHDKEIIEITKEQSEIKNDSIVLAQLNLLIVQVDSIQNGLSKVAGGMDQQNIVLGIMKKQLGNHIVNTATKEDIKQWINAWEEKKSENYFNEIPSEQNNTMIPFSYKYEQKK